MNPSYPAVGHHRPAESGRGRDKGFFTCHAAKDVKPSRGQGGALNTARWYTILSTRKSLDLQTHGILPVSPDCRSALDAW